MNGRVLAAVLAAWVSGCSLGMSPADFEPAHSPDGVYVAITSTDGEFLGELLAVSDETLLVLGRPTDDLARDFKRNRDFLRFSEGRIARPRLLEFPFSSIERVRVRQRPDIRPSGLRRSDRRQALRRLSRYPQGVSETLLSRLLEAYGLESVERMGVGS